MSVFSFDPSIIEQAQRAGDIARALPNIQPQSDEMFHLVDQTIQRRGQAMAAGVMNLYLQANDVLWLLVEQEHRERYVAPRRRIRRTRRRIAFNVRPDGPTGEELIAMTEDRGLHSGLAQAGRGMLLWGETEGQSSSFNF